MFISFSYILIDWLQADLLKNRSELLTMTQVLTKAPVTQLKRGQRSMEELFAAHESRLKKKKYSIENDQRCQSYFAISQ